MAGEKKKKQEKKKNSDELLIEEGEFVFDGEGETEEDVVPSDYGDTQELVVKIEKLKKKLVASEKEKQEYLDGWQRARAEFVKAKKDEVLAHEQASRKAKVKIIEDFFPVADSFKMAFANKEAWEKVDANWRKGVEYIYSQLEGAFEREGVRRFLPVGEAFDHRRHESMEVVFVKEEEQDGVVVEVMQEGYEMKGEMIRPAKVKVGKLKR